MEYSPPPLFKQGASARVKMLVFAGISVGLLLADSHLRALPAVRAAVGTVLYPLQMAALVPRDAAAHVGAYFSNVTVLEQQVKAMQREQIATALAVQQARLQASENQHLRQLLEARAHVPVKSIMSEILYDARDLFTRKIVLDRGSSEGVVPGLPVIDNLGVVGQITRVFPFTSEVTLLTDKEQAIPVQVLRNGLRSVAYGRGQSGSLELRFTTPNADIVVGDVLITSGLDGVYPAGLAVAKVSQVESNNSAGAFGHVVCQPLAGIERNTQLLILTGKPDMLPRPPAEEPKSGRSVAGKMAPIKDPPKEPAKEGEGATTAAPAANPVTKPAANPVTKPAANPVTKEATR